MKVIQFKIGKQAIINSAAMNIPATLYARQKKRHRCIEQAFGFYGRRRGWDDLREQHRNMYIIKCETDRQSRLDA